MRNKLRVSPAPRDYFESLVNSIFTELVDLILMYGTSSVETKQCDKMCEVLAKVSQLRKCCVLLISVGEERNPQGELSEVLLRYSSDFVQELSGY